MQFEQIQNYKIFFFSYYFQTLAIVLLLTIIFLTRSNLKKRKIQSFETAISAEMTLTKRQANNFALEIIQVAIIFVLLTSPVFYLLYQERQYYYCKEIVSVEYITDPEDSLFLDSCSFFDAREFFPERYR